MPPPVDPSGTVQTVEGTEPVLLFVRTGEGTFAAPVPVENAKRRAPDLSVLMEVGAQLPSQALVWHLWKGNGRLGNTAPKEGDVIQDEDGVRWTVKTLAVQSLKARYRCACLKERP